MRIPPPGVSLHPTQTLKEKAPVTTSTKPFLAKDQASARAKTRVPLGSLPISQAELKALAADLKNGVIDSDEANSRFVKTVINNSIRNKLGEKDREQLIHDIKELFASDQDFVQRLAKNLGDLA